MRKKIIGMLVCTLLIASSLTLFGSETVRAQENHAPIAYDDTYSIIENSTFSVSAPGILSNDTDEDGDSLTVILVDDVCNGSLSLNENGSFTYTPDPGFIGVDLFVYQAYDGVNYSNITLVIIVVNANLSCVEDFEMTETHCGSGWTNHNSPMYSWWGRTDSWWEYRYYYPGYYYRLDYYGFYYTGYLDGNRVIYQIRGSDDWMSYHPTLTEGTHSFKVYEDVLVVRYRWDGYWRYYGSYLYNYDVSNEIYVYIDTSPPTGSIIINGGDTETYSTSVTLTLSYSDSYSGVSQVRYSNDGNFDTEPWEDPSPSKSWTLERGGGPKTVWYEVKDNVGYIFTTQDDIELIIPPVADFTYEPGEPKIGDLIEFTDTSTDSDGPIVSWWWDFDDGYYSDLQNPIHIYYAVGTYDVTLTVTDDDEETDNIAISIVVTVVTHP